MTEVPFIREHRDDVVRITLDAPEHNSLTLDGVGRLREAITEAAGLRAKLLVLAGAGGHFCHGRLRGGDRPAHDGWEVRNERLQPILDLYDAVYEHPVPVLAVVEGGAHGLGCALVAACDVAIGSEESSFSLPEMTVGSPPLLAMSSLASKLPAARLLRLVLTGEVMTGRQAYEAGLLSMVRPAATLADDAERFVAPCTTRPGSALQAVKSYARELRRASGVVDGLASALLALDKVSR